jgi:branched-chain amino acid transport system substrate-binding protein
MLKTTRRTFVLSTLGFASLRVRAAEPVQFAHISPTSSPMAKDAEDIRLGLSAGFAEFTRKSRRNLVLLKADEDAGPNGLGLRLESLCKRAPTVLLAPIGPVAIGQLLRSGVLERNDALLINPIPGAEPFRKPTHPKVLHVRASDTDQVARIIQHANTIGIRRLALITEKDGSPAAESIWATAQAVAAKIGAIEVRHFSVVTPPEAPAALQQSGYSPQAVLSAGAPPFMAIISNLVRQLIPGMHTYALSYLTPDVAVQVLGEKARGIGISQVYPSLSKGHLPFIKSFREAMALVSPAAAKLNAYHVEGYVVARLATMAAVSPRGSTPAGVASVLREAGRIDLNGYEVDFSSSNEGSRYVEMGIIDSAGSLRS